MRILVLGDSITDCGHCFTADNLGNGYVKYMDQLLRAEPDSADISVTNGGSDGFTFERMLSKWRRMYRPAFCRLGEAVPGENTALHPGYDIAVIQGGINEVSILMETGLDRAGQQAVLARAQQALSALLAETAQAGIRSVCVVEPFLFRQPAWLTLWLPCLEQVRTMMRETVQAVVRDHASNISSHEDTFSHRRTDASSQAGCDYAARIISVQHPLNKLIAQSGIDSVTTDGIHLTPAGHRCLAEQLLPFLLYHA